MATTSSVLVERSRPKLCLLDLPREIRDRIYGYVVRSAYYVLPTRVPGLLKELGDDFSHESILRVSKRTNCEAMQVLQRRSWFIYNMDFVWYYRSFVGRAPTQQMMNCELIVGRYCSCHDMARVIRSFGGTNILRRTCHILIPASSRILMYYAVPDTAILPDLWRFFQLIKLLNGFTTVVLQINLQQAESIRSVKDSRVFDCAKLLTDIEDVLEPALGPAMPCGPVWGQRRGMNFRFFPRRFLAK